MTMSGETVRVYIQSPRWFLRPHNTDWRYTRFLIPRIHEFSPECAFYGAQSIATALRMNARYSNELLRSKLHLEPSPLFAPVLDRAEFFRSKSNVVFCHDEFPKNTHSVPFVWQNSILDQQMALHWGYTADVLAQDRELKQSGFEKATAVQVSSHAEAARLSEWFPHLANRFVAIPFFLPDVTSLDLARLEEKLQRRSRLQCLFVGHEARRKGLERVYTAMDRLPAETRNQISLTVVSEFRDGPVNAPSLPHLNILRGAPHAQVLALMKEQDVFIMPSHFESYGLAYVEAMAQGMVPIVPDWEVQREIVDYGRAGIVTDGDPVRLAAVLTELLENPTLRSTLALAAWNRFRQSFAPAIVANQYSRLFRRCAADL